MKKTISIILSAVLLASSLFMTAYAGEAELSHEHLKLLMRAADTVCDLYATYDTGDYAEAIMEDLAEMFPDAVVETYDGQPQRIIASESQIKAAVNAKWGYLSDKTLEEFFYSGLRFYCLKEDGKYELTRHPHGGGLASKFAAKGILVGYTVDDSGVCRLYYSTRYAKETANEFFGSGDSANAFWEEVEKQGYPAEIKYNYLTFVEFEGDYYRMVQNTRVFEFRFNGAGLAEYVTDEFIMGFPVSMTCIGGDINGDGEVDNKDVVTLFKYLSGVRLHVNSFVLDTNGDEETDNKDVVWLFRYCSGEDITLNNSPTLKG